MIKPQPKLRTISDRELFRRHIQVVLLALFWMTMNFMLGEFFFLGRSDQPSGLPVYGTIGGLLTQLAIVAYLLVLLPIPFFVRLIISTLIGASFFCAVLLGAIFFESFDAGEIIRIYLCAPAIVMGFAFPFALAKSYLNWRIETNWWPNYPNRGMSVSGLMGSTMLVAVSLVIAQQSNNISLGFTFVMAAIAAGVGFSILLPISLFVTRVQYSMLWLTVVFVFAMILGAHLVNVFAWPSRRFWEGVGMIFSCTSAVYMYALALAALDLSGLHLRTDITFCQNHPVHLSS